MGNKIIIDEKDFNEKVMGWIERRTYVTSNDLIALLKDLTTTISIDESIEERAKKKYTEIQSKEHNALQGCVKLGYIEGATEQSIIFEIKSKDKCKHEPIGLNGRFTHCVKCGMLLQLNP